MRWWSAIVVACAAVATASPSWGATSHLVISEFRTRGLLGANDEFVEIYNPTDAVVDIGGYKLMSSDAVGITSVRAVVPAGKKLKAKGFYLFTGPLYAGSAAGDQTYATGLPDTGGFAFVTPVGAIVDQVGIGLSGAYQEGARLSVMTLNLTQSYERKGGSCTPSQDTDVNTADFAYGLFSNPQNSNTVCDACAGVLCLSPPNLLCYVSAGVCVNGACEYAMLPQNTPCSDLDACTSNTVCDGQGHCGGSPTVCNEPPPDFCVNGSTARHFSSSGSCSSGDGCSYGHTDEACQFGCNGLTGACLPSPCGPAGCNAPPNGCFESAGACVLGACVYTPKTLGVACEDGNACTVGDVCSGLGTCVPGAPKATGDNNVCTADACDPATGTVSHVAVTPGTTCALGDLCHAASTCQGTSCTTGAAVTCDNPPQGGCYEAAGACNPATGACSYQPSQAGTACDDGNTCTTGDTCDGNGHCGGSTTVCAPQAPTCQGSVSVALNAGVCLGPVGLCAYVAVNTPCLHGCDEATGLCKGDPCAGVVCLNPPDGCHMPVGTCSNGACSYALAPVGAACSDGNTCTTNDACSAGGACQGTALACNTPPAPACVTPLLSVTYDAAGACGLLGTCSYTPHEALCAHGCDASTGLCKGDPCLGVNCDSPPDTCHQSQGTCVAGACVYGVKPLGATCDDGDVCTEGDRCDLLATCRGTGKHCNAPPPAACLNGTTSRSYASAGACSSLDGACSYAPTDTACTHGCDGATGLCRGDPCTGVVCNSPPGACYQQAGTCSNGTCSYAPLAVGVSCSDGNTCTTGDTCDGSGACKGATTVCAPQAPTCQGSVSVALTAGLCLGPVGLCTYVAVNTPCANGCNPTTGLCQGDPCVGVVCNQPPDGCHVPTGTCSGGQCSYALAPAGAACSDGNTCTTNDACSAAGACQGTALACNTPPAPACVSTGVSRSFDAAGSCGGNGTCSYTSTDTNCAHGCDGATGLCKGDPCLGVTCNTPPDACHQAQGTCSEGACTYGLKPVGASCSDGDVCTDGDRCDAAGVCQGAGKVCNEPPAALCTDSVTSRSFDAAGACSASDGSCVYTHTDTHCLAGCDDETGLCRNDPCADVVCVTPPGPCFMPTGTCQEGVCSYGPIPGGVACDDGDQCTEGDACDGNGVCASGELGDSCGGASGAAGAGGTSGSGTGGSNTGGTGAGGNGTGGTSGTGGSSGAGGSGAGGSNTGGSDTGGSDTGGTGGSGTGGSGTGGTGTSGTGTGGSGTGGNGGSDTGGNGTGGSSGTGGSGTSGTGGSDTGGSGTGGSGTGGSDTGGAGGVSGTGGSDTGGSGTGGTGGSSGSGGNGTGGSDTGGSGTGGSGTGGSGTGGSETGGTGGDGGSGTGGSDTGGSGGTGGSNTGGSGTGGSGTSGSGTGGSETGGSGTGGNGTGGNGTGGNGTGGNDTGGTGTGGSGTSGTGGSGTGGSDTGGSDTGGAGGASGTGGAAGTGGSGTSGAGGSDTSGAGGSGAGGSGAGGSGGSGAGGAGGNGTAGTTGDAGSGGSGDSGQAGAGGTSNESGSGGSGSGSAGSDNTSGAAGQGDAGAGTSGLGGAAGSSSEVPNGVPGGNEDHGVRLVGGCSVAEGGGSKMPRSAGAALFAALALLARRGSRRGRR